MESLGVGRSRSFERRTFNVFDAASDLSCSGPPPAPQEADLHAARTARPQRRE